MSAVGVRLGKHTVNELDPHVYLFQCVSNANQHLLGCLGNVVHIVTVGFVHMMLLPSSKEQWATQRALKLHVIIEPFIH